VLQRVAALRMTPGMGWLRLGGSLKLQVSFAKDPYKRDIILQKRPTILRSLLIVATSQLFLQDLMVSPPLFRLFALACFILICLFPLLLGVEFVLTTKSRYPKDVGAFFFPFCFSVLVCIALTPTQKLIPKNQKKDALDSDGGGEIELDELTEYWDSYIFDGWK